MKLSLSSLVIPLFVVFFSCVNAEKGDVTSLQIGVKYRPTSCPIKAENGDELSMHYKGTLTDGTQFDSSLDRNQPFNFRLGARQVIQGWDKGLLGMCIGEKRKLRIPPDMGYGERGSPPKIPPQATLVFEVELLRILNKEHPEEQKDEL